MRGGNKEGGYGLSAKAVRKHIKVDSQGTEIAVHWS